MSRSAGLTIALLSAGCSASTVANVAAAPRDASANAASAAPALEPIRVDAAVLAHAYHADAPAAERRFGNRPLIVKGTVSAVEDSNGSVAVVLGSKASNGQVRVMPLREDAGEIRNAGAARVGNLLAVACASIDGAAGDVVLHDCTGFDP